MIDWAKKTHWEIQRSISPKIQVLLDQDVASFKAGGLDVTSFDDFNTWLSTGGRQSLFVLSAFGATARLPPGPAKNEALQSSLFLVWASTALRAFGDRTFVVTKRLAERLLLTNLKHVPVDLIKIPYPAMYIQYPSGPMCVYNNETGEHPLNGVYVIDDRNSKNPVIKLIFTGASKDPKNLTDDALFHLTVKWADILAGGDVNDITNRIVSRWSAPHDWGTENVNRIEDYMRLFFNTILFISSTSSDVIQLFNPEWRALSDRRTVALGQKKTEKARRIWDDMKKVPPRERFVIGTSIQKDLMPHGENLGNSAVRAEAMRHVVRGHWKPVLAERLGHAVWVQPYHRGVDVGAIIAGPKRRADEPDDK